MRAQTTIEYIILIAIVLMIAAFSVNILLGASKSKDNLILTNCQTSAKRCDFLKTLNGTATDCSVSCLEECADPLTHKDLLTGNPASVSAGAVKCCNSGNLNAIYFGAPGC